MKKKKINGKSAVSGFVSGAGMSFLNKKNVYSSIRKSSASSFASSARKKLQDIFSKNILKR